MSIRTILIVTKWYLVTTALGIGDWELGIGDWESGQNSCRDIAVLRLYKDFG
ncbi:hypothetical protein [Nostoc sp.]|uniref:hypothetical protein n=1 Tax=Nostoc sp. TaxID=1180 RepID=UPI002FF8E259